MDAVEPALSIACVWVCILTELRRLISARGLPAAGRVIAQALRMDYAFLCEFEELHSPLRDANSQVPLQTSFDASPAQVLCPQSILQTTPVITWPFWSGALPVTGWRSAWQCHP